MLDQRATHLSEIYAFVTIPLSSFNEIMDIFKLQDHNEKQLCRISIYTKSNEENPMNFSTLNIMTTSTNRACGISFISK